MPNPKDMKKKTSFSIIYIFLALLIFSLLQLWLAPKVENVSYTQFKKLIGDGKINSVVVSTKFLKGYEKVQDGKKEPLFPQLLYMTPRIDDRNLVDFLEKNNAEIIAENENTFLMTLLSWVLPALIFVGIWLWAMKKMGQGTGIMTLGKNKAKIVAQTDVGITFDDVAGEDEAKQELQEILEFLKNPTKFTKLGAKIPKGVLTSRPAGHRKDSPCKSSGRRSRCAVFLDQWLGFHRDVCGAGRGPSQGPLRRGR